MRDQPVHNVLVVDDDKFSNSILGKILERLGCEVTSFEQSRAAEAWLLDNHAKISLVITDMYMPGLTGLDLARRVREEGFNIPLVIYTGATQDELKPLLDNGDIFKVLSKPVQASEIQKLLSQINSK